MTNAEYIRLLTLKELFEARDAVKTLIDLGFNKEYLLSLEKDIEIELSKAQEKNPNIVFSRLFGSVGELLKEL